MIVALCGLFVGVVCGVCGLCMLFGLCYLGVFAGFVCLSVVLV